MSPREWRRMRGPGQACPGSPRGGPTSWGSLRMVITHEEGSVMALKSKGLVPRGGMNGRVPDDVPACETCVDVVYIDRQGEERSVALRADLAPDFTDREELFPCRQCAKLCLPVLYEDYEGGHTEHTCYLCDFEWMVRDGTQVDPTGKSGAELAAEYARRQDSYYRAVSPVSAVRKVWS